MPKTITIRLNEEEEMMMNKIEKMYNCGISTALKRLVQEKLEDEYDRKAVEEFRENVKKGKEKFYSFEEFEKMLDLWNIE